MKLVLVSSFVPFINGGGRFIVEWLEEKLREYGHEVERFYLPFVDDPQALMTQISAYRLMDLASVGDRLIAFRPPAYVIQHPHKMLWFIHHIRVFYDLWGDPHGLPTTPANLRVKLALHRTDNITIGEAKKVYTNSRVVSDRLSRFNGIASQPLYPPLLNPEQFKHSGYGDEILCVCRIEPHKRQLLLVEAMRHVKTAVKLRICGRAAGLEYPDQIRKRIAESGLAGRVKFADAWISDEEKVRRYEGALAVAYVPIDEDGIGYPCFEAAHSRKALITTSDSGAVLEFAKDGLNGFVVDPDPEAIAEAMDRLYLDRLLAKTYGDANLNRLSDLVIDWSHVVEAFTS